MPSKKETPTHGGARPGAGRKVTNPTRPITLRLNAAQEAEFFARGGATAVKAWLDSKRVTPAVRRGCMTCNLDMTVYADTKDDEGDKREASDVRAFLSWAYDHAGPDHGRPS